MFPGVAFLVLVLGLVLWLAGRGEKVTLAGKILFACGAFVVTWHLGDRGWRLPF